MPHKNEYKNRLRRLLTIILEVKTVPRQGVPELIEKLGVSKAQFYKDRALSGKKPERAGGRDEREAGGESWRIGG